MARIIVRQDCGNSPRKLSLKDLNVACAKGDLEFISQYIPETISLYIVGTKVIYGRSAFLSELVNFKRWNVALMEIETIITHGSEASVSGKITAADGATFEFCDVYKFKSAGGLNLKTITSFNIQTSPPELNAC